MLQPVIALMHDLVDRERCDPAVRMRFARRSQFRGDRRQPVVEQLGRPRIQRREAADDPGLGTGR